MCRLEREFGKADRADAAWPRGLRQRPACRLGARAEGRGPGLVADDAAADGGGDRCLRRVADFVIGEQVTIADLDRRRVDLDRVDHTELLEVADMVVRGGHAQSRCPLRAWSEPELGKQMRRRLVAELGVELDVQMVVFVALPGVHGGAESRLQFGHWHAGHSLLSVDGRPNGRKSHRNRLFSRVPGLRHDDSWITLARQRCPGASGRRW